MPVSAQSVVSIDYTLTDDKGQTLDTSQGREPLAYLHGAGNIVPGLEKALEGQEVGATLEVAVAPDEGYGHFEAGLVRNVPVRKLPQGRAQAGQRLRLDTSAGPRIFTVKSVKGDYAQLDGNHPLAGQTLHFKVTIVSVRAPTAEELAHGHVHGAGGHAH
jgi:FKBP-type peptidyl-prolyl cis-trans isomerase SlyD